MKKSIMIFMLNFIIIVILSGCGEQSEEAKNLNNDDQIQDSNLVDDNGEDEKNEPSNNTISNNTTKEERESNDNSEKETDETSNNNTNDTTTDEKDSTDSSEDEIESTDSSEEEKDAPKATNTVKIHDIFPMRSASNLTNEERKQAHEDSMEYDEMKYYIQALNPEYNRYINGTFNWDYRNTNNKSDFLAFRGGNYYYIDESYSADKLYDEIHRKMKKHKLTVDVSFNYDIEDIFVHPERGGYVVSEILSLRFNSDDNNTEIKGYEMGKWYSVRYEAAFGFKTLHDTDNWAFWYQGDYGLLIKGLEYKIGEFK